MINEPDHHFHLPPPPPDHEREGSSKSFLPIIVFILVVYFSLQYRPSHPTLVVTAVKLPYYTLSFGGSTSFTFTFYATVTNPTYGVFSYSSTYSHLLYAGQHVGYMIIPGRHIAPRHENLMEVSMSVKDLPVLKAPYIPALRGVLYRRPTMELRFYMKIVGRVTSYWLFTSQVERVIDCNVTVDISDGSVLFTYC